MIEKEFILSIELVPKPLWYVNLRNKVGVKKWDELRKTCYHNYNNKCGICKTEGRINCHEIWKYDDINHIQKLDGFIALCNNCHNIKHIGLSGILATNGKLDYNELIEHFCKINNCTLKEFKKHEKEMFKLWNKRSNYEWKQDLNNLEN